MIIFTFFIFSFSYILFCNITFQCHNYIKYLPLLFFITVKLAGVRHTLFTRESIDDLVCHDLSVAEGSYISSGMRIQAQVRKSEASELSQGTR